jgi:hypothetical protein
MYSHFDLQVVLYGSFMQKCCYIPFFNASSWCGHWCIAASYVYFVCMDTNSDCLFCCQQIRHIFNWFLDMCNYKRLHVCKIQYQHVRKIIPARVQVHLHVSNVPLKSIQFNTCGFTWHICAKHRYIH